ncbi:hypothetical protein LQZ24_02005 [Fructobacillus sp. M1-13]|uniref:phosphomevalonate kinase n=1 Tax=Fructobacillus papyriferae TaxID=2713171 RepID=A0ABS5QNU2_9LACO|nr:hypothetical protein [Fructobacillus papyriferae]MBS9334813.1 hypothetical protein [Fructobacillus papyriferae]MCD2158803.1 hypothetical protein [Fructobacillus papyriferae]
MNKPLRLQIPGKLFLAGEYAVTTPGQPALLRPVDRGMVIEASLQEEQSGQITLYSDQFEEAEKTSWSALSVQNEQALKEDNWSFTKVALQLFQEAQSQLSLKERPGIKLTIRSQMTSQEGKLGLGSSAAVTVAIIMALHQVYLPKKENNQRAIFKEAAFAHYFVQGSGSLGDIATATYQKTIFYQAPIWIKEKRQWQLQDFHTLDWSNLQIKSLDWPKSWSFAIVATHEPASTKKALAKESDKEALLEPSKTAVMAAKNAIEEADYDALKSALKENQKALKAHLPKGYVTEKLQDFLTITNRLDLAGKISGAGFGDNGFVVGNETHSLFPMKTAARKAALTIID